MKEKKGSLDFRPRFHELKKRAFAHEEKIKEKIGLSSSLSLIKEEGFHLQRNGRRLDFRPRFRRLRRREGDDQTGR